ncbi:Predicted transcriptional regulator [Serratia liquefaciens]|uniref:helix-turn-helix transcriptional regulator n=1 Tax=Serratia liquefaciens TaxID=614 RepID=UPI0021771B6A|nr:AlpA family phage regulatory protein [Serratia liquefaciens]CAI1819272.1 Predicted transcriptional regulator [Serratia liquefaciens]
MNNHIICTDRTIREPECRQLTGLCRTTRYLMEREGKFPARRKLGGRAVGWLLSEIQVWQKSQPKVSHHKAV